MRGIPSRAAKDALRIPRDDGVKTSSASSSVAAAITWPTSAAWSMAVSCEEDSRSGGVGSKVDVDGGTYVVGAVDTRFVVGGDVVGRPVGLIVGGYVKSPLTSKGNVSPLP